MTAATDEEARLHTDAAETAVVSKSDQPDQAEQSGDARTLPVAVADEEATPVESLIRPVAANATAAAEEPRDEDKSDDALPVGTILRPVGEDDVTDAIDQPGNVVADVAAAEQPSVASIADATSGQAGAVSPGADATSTEAQQSAASIREAAPAVSPEIPERTSAANATSAERQIEQLEEVPEEQQALETPRGPRLWSVDTSYIDHRTADPNCREVRRAVQAEAEVAPAGTGVGAVATSVSTRGQDGRWQVDMSYINHRTGEVDNLEGRRSVLAASAEGAVGGGDAAAGKPASAPPSATVRREGGGKWRVDTSYIGYRTADPSNVRREDGKARQDQFADPSEKKYDYETLKSGSPRPADVDPTCKELYLLEEEFRTLFGMDHKDFARMPKWKQQNLKKKKQLF